MKSTNKLTSLNVTLDELYNGEKQIVIALADRDTKYNVVMQGRNQKPDCKISSFRDNLWFRTPKGQNSERYPTLSSLQTALTRAVGSRIVTTGDITFSITTDIFTM